MGRLLSIGNSLFQGQCAKSVLSGFARQHLLSALLAAGETNERVTNTDQVTKRATPKPAPDQPGAFLPNRAVMALTEIPQFRSTKLATW